MGNSGCTAPVVLNRLDEAIGRLLLGGEIMSFPCMQGAAFVDYVIPYNAQVKLAMSDTDNMYRSIGILQTSWRC